MSGAVVTRTIRNWDEVTPLAESWNALVAASEPCTVFQTFEWHDAWWRNFGSEHELLVVCAFRGDELRAVAPMMISATEFQRRPRRVLRFIGTSNYASDYCNFVLPEEASREAMAATLLEAIAAEPDWDIAELSRFPTESPWRGVVERKLRSLVPVLHATIETEAPSRILRDADDDKAIVDSKSFRRDFGWFEKRGALKFEHLMKPEDERRIAEQLDDFFQQHIDRRALIGDRSQFLDPRQKQFYRDLTASMLPRGWLRFAAVKWNDKALAYHFGFEFARRFVLYKPTFNVELEKKSPGKVLVKFLIEDAVDRQLDEFDFTVGEESYKYRFANVIRTNTKFRAFRSHLDGWAFLLLERLRPIVRRIRRTVSK